MPPPRPDVDRRASYEPQHPPEMFIVPLLRRCIESALSTHARPLGPSGKALDIGCGRQPFRPHLEEYGFQYFGLDTQPAADGSVAFVAPIDGELPPEVRQAGPFQFLLCTEVFEHVADWRTGFANLANLTATSGRVLITAPHYYILHEEPYDFWRPTLHAIRYYAEWAGFRVVHAEAAGTPWDVLGTWLGGVGIYPAGRSPITRVLTWMVRFSRYITFAALKRGWVQPRVILGGKTYLSNVVVLERE